MQYLGVKTNVEVIFVVLSDDRKRLVVCGDGEESKIDLMSIDASRLMGAVVLHAVSLCIVCFSSARTIVVFAASNLYLYCSKQMITVTICPVWERQ